MDSKEREKISAVIREQINELESSMGDISSTKQQLTDHSEDDETRMEILANAPVNETTQLQMRAKLECLRSNLDWIWSEHGGECTECGREIPIGRLTIVPTTRLCVDCSSKHEEQV